MVVGGPVVGFGAAAVAWILVERWGSGGVAAIGHAASAGMLALNVFALVPAATAGGPTDGLRLLRLARRSTAEAEADRFALIAEQLLTRPYGLILLTGPTGAGKTTTLYSMLNQLNQVDRSIVTVEDPVEYELPGINQTATNLHIGYDFAKAIRHILRHDPDIIMIGEIRDKETAEIAIRAALTGHLVLSTMHTNSAVGAVTRLLEMDIEPFLISSALAGVISQRLVRRLCPRCKTTEPGCPEAQQKIRAYIPDAKSFILAKPQGCESCSGTGFQDRVGVYEILKMDEDIRYLIIKTAGESEIADMAKTKKMKPLAVSGMEKVVAQTTEFHETIRNVLLDG